MGNAPSPVLHAYARPPAVVPGTVEGRRDVLLKRACICLDAITLERLRAYIAERTEEVYPQEYHVYRRRWEQLATGNTQGSAHWPKLEYMEWRRIVDALTDELRLSDLLSEGESAQAREWRAMLMLDPEPQDRPLGDNW
jgi:hypothetical protein